PGGGWRAGRPRARHGPGDWQLFEPGWDGVPAVARPHRPGHTVGEPAEWQEQSVPRQVRLPHERADDTADAHEGGPQRDTEHRPPEPDRGTRAVERHRQFERRHEPGRRHRGLTALRRDGNGRVAARRGDDDGLRRARERDQQQPDHERLPLMPRASSRSATRRFRSSRLSCSFLALASAIATLAVPFLKYNSSGTSVSPLRLVPPMSLRISCAWSSSLRERAGGGLL